jgi:hypothetical protein
MRRILSFAATWIGRLLARWRIESSPRKSKLLRKPHMASIKPRWKRPISHIPTPSKQSRARTFHLIYTKSRIPTTRHLLLSQKLWESRILRLKKLPKPTRSSPVGTRSRRFSANRWSSSLSTIEILYEQPLEPRSWTFSRQLLALSRQPKVCIPRQPQRSQL